MPTELQSPPPLPATNVFTAPPAPTGDPSRLSPALETLIRSRAIELRANALNPGKALLLIREEVLGALGNGPDPATVKTALRQVVDMIFETYRQNG